MSEACRLIGISIQYVGGKYVDMSILRTSVSGGDFFLLDIQGYNILGWNIDA